MAKVTIFPRRPIDAEQARFYAETLDKMEADLVGFTHQLFRIRQALQNIVGETVGFQYDDERTPPVTSREESSRNIETKE
jgi:late competence protein required for DNA uptake (superfamily II DNA/RNA helicase)